MNYRCIVYNFIKEQASIIYNLPNTFDIIEWFSYPPHGTVDIKEFAHVNYNVKDTYGLGVDIYPQVFRCFPQFLDMQQRRYPSFTNSIYDLQRDFNNQFAAIYGFLTDSKPDFILLGNIPHGGHDLLLYKIAKELEIVVFILYQFPIYPHYFLLTEFERFEYGKSVINSGRVYNENLPDVQVPIYMRSQKKVVQKSVVKQIKSLLALYLRKEKRIKKKKQSQYDKLLKRHITRVGDMPDYIYFPLHLQPEMTTASLGNEYVDQILAIERLARKVGNKTTIVVKENPKQTYFQRPKNFFSRLEVIPNVILVGKNVSSFDLIKESIAVATITGTAGWEALCWGKPAIIFGNAWYQHLPGVLKFDSSFSIENLRSFVFHKNRLEMAFNKLLTYSFPGIVQSAYFGLEKDFDKEKNNRQIAENLNKVINSILKVEKKGESKNSK